jgi:hypothetical protein
LDINYLRRRFITAEAILNEAYLLGISKGPSKDYKQLIIDNKDKDVVDFRKVIEQVNTYI